MARLRKGYYIDHFGMKVVQGILNLSDIQIYYQIGYIQECMVLLWFHQGIDIYDFLLR